MKSSVPRLVLTIIPMLLLASIPVKAAGVTEVRINHEKGRVFVIENGTSRTDRGYPLDADPTVDVLKGDQVRVLIEDPNPVLFDYKLKKLDAVVTTNQKELLELATALDALVGSLGAGISEASRRSTESNRPSSMVSSCNVSIAALGQFKTVVQNIETARKDYETVISTSLTSPDQSKKMVRDWKLAQLNKDLTKAREALEKAADTLLKSGSPDPCAGLVALAQGRAQDVQKTLDELKILEDLVEQIGLPLDLEPFHVRITEEQPVQVTIARSSNFPDDLADDTRLVGELTITIVPRSRVAISVAPAMVYSFVRDPSYEVEEVEDQLFIRQKENPYKELNLAAMLQLEPHAWDLGPVNIGVQLGVAPESDLGLFLGLSLRASDLFTFGAGVAFQEVNRLQEGLSPNQAIASEDLLKTEKDFVEGLYIHLTVSLPDMD